MRRWLVMGTVVAGMALVGACNKEKPASSDSSAQESKLRDRGKFPDSGTRTTQPAGTGPTTTQPADTISGMPTGNMPNDAVHAPLRPGANVAPQFNPPAEWQIRAAREMTDQVFALPKVDGDPDDADLAISHLSQHIPMQGNIARWAGMFGYQGAAIDQNVKKKDLEGTHFPTIIVDISGTYKGGSMMAQAAAPKENYRMLVAEIRAPQRPYYVRMVGPQKTVAKWEESFMSFVRDAAQ
jgi:hypothetical protein